MGPVNDGLRFVLEMVALYAVAAWGHSHFDGALRWVAAVGLPVLLAVIWVVFVNPNGSHVTRDPARLLLELAIFGTAAAALLDVRGDRFALIFAVVAAVHLALTFPLDQR